MYNLGQGTNKSCELEEVLNLYRLGFIVIPLRDDSVTPNVPSTNDIYINPNYWTEEKFRKDHHLFHNVATLLGKSHIKDNDGNDLYLNVIDIDCEAVYSRLARITKDGKDVNLIDELCKSTYVTKTKKSLVFTLIGSAITSISLYVTETASPVMNLRSRQVTLLAIQLFHAADTGWTQIFATRVLDRMQSQFEISCTKV
jgi:hypothetical protein